MLKSLNVVLYILLLFRFSTQQGYTVPEATIQLLYPKGFTVSIPDEPGIKLFAFHGKLNEEFDGREGGSYSRDITLAKNGKWTFTDRETRFKLGDTIHYWLYVDYFDGRNKLGYPSGFRQYVVTECPRNIVKDGVCSGLDSNEYEIPDAKVEILKPRGFKVSIPDQEGIKLFAFHGKINEDFDGREAGQFARDITVSNNGRWTFVDETIKFKPGDTLYYWLYVIHRRNNGNEIGHIKENQLYVIPGTSQETCHTSATVWNGKNTCSGQLLFHEEFLSLNSNNWTTEIRFADGPDYEFVIYEESDININTRNGELHIKPVLADEILGEGFIYSREGYNLGDRCTSRIPHNCNQKPVGGYPLPPIFSSQISSKAYFKYGKVDIRAKLPAGDWIYPQLFLNPKLHEYGTKDYDSGQIRIAFVNGNKRLNNELQGNILLGTSPYARTFNIKRFKKSNNEGWSDNYHIYSVIWTPDSIKFLVDGDEFGEIIPPPNGFSEFLSNEKPTAAKKWTAGRAIAPFDKEMILQIGVGVGGHSFPDTILNKPYNNTESKPQIKFYNARDSWKPTWNEQELIIDYVKIYAV